MARGWESKAVDDQIADAADARGARAEPERTADERARAARRVQLQMARTRALQDLQLACDRRHRALLERTVAHLDEELKGLTPDA